MTVRLLCFIVVLLVFFQLAFEGRLPGGAGVVGVQGVRSAFEFLTR